MNILLEDASIIEEVTLSEEAILAKPEFPLVGLHIFLINQSIQKILLIKRANTGFYDGLWAAPSGKLEKNESFSDGAKRELLEEVGIIAKTGSWNSPRILYSKRTDKGCFHVSYVCTEWEWTPANKEPDKCDGVEWFDLNKLPEDIVPHVRYTLEKILSA